MAITPKAGYQVDPSNPNGVIPIPGNIVQANPQPPAEAIPSAPPVNPNANYNAGVTPTAPTTTPTETPATQQPLVMPSNGSVVDLLNGAGQNSSLESRTQLAQQFGIQGYTGTATQNTDLAKKYLDFYNTKKGTEAPNQNPMRTPEAQTLLNGGQQTDPQQGFFDQYMTMNPVVKQLYDTINQTLSSQGTQQTFAQQYQDLTKQLGIPALQTDLMNVQNVMNGTEDDIRDEITAAGGFSTESQVLALTGARNKTLLKQANSLQAQLQAKDDYVDKIMAFSQADRAEVDKQVEQKLGLTQQLADIQDKITNAAKDNYNSIIKTQGYGGLYDALKGDPQQISQVESLLGLGAGGLKALSNYVVPATPMEALQLQNLKLQNQKLSQSLNGGGADLQFVAGTANQPAGVFDKNTGKFTPIDSKGVAAEQQLALGKSNIDQVSTLLASTALAGVVGPNILARNEFFNKYNGNSSNFLGGMTQLTNQLTLSNLQNAKANGATFGALSEGELNLVSSSASKLNSWAIKDGNGNVTGYSIDEKSFKQELDKINSFAKMDYILKGGDPASVGVQQMQDGTLWSQNSDGSYTEIK